MFVAARLIERRIAFTMLRRETSKREAYDRVGVGSESDLVSSLLKAIKDDAAALFQASCVIRRRLSLCIQVFRTMRDTIGFGVAGCMLMCNAAWARALWYCC